MASIPYAIRMEGVKKEYRLGAIGGRTLQADLQSWWAQKRGREDPNQRIGQRALSGDAFYALDGIDLTVQPGERLGIIGPNGAGKSTLLKLLCRITAPTEGDIDIYGRVASMLEVGTGFHGELTGRENIYMNGAILGMTRAEIDRRMEEIIDFSEVREFIDTPVKRYSSGMYVKLAFSVAAHLTSEIMIMDEVLAVGDMAFQHKCLDRMRAAADEEGRTVLYVSHNMSTIRRLCNRCIVLQKGKIIFDGAPEKAIAAYMDSGMGRGTVDMDLSALPRAVAAPVGAPRMTHLILPGKDTPTYAPGEPLRLALTVDAPAPIPGVSVRLTLRNGEDTGLATAWSEPRDLAPGLSTLHLTVPLDTVAKGEFYVSLGLYQTDELGRPRTLDHLTRACRIDCQGLPTWAVPAHGYFRLPPLQWL